MDSNFKARAHMVVIEAHIQPDGTIKVIAFPHSTEVYTGAKSVFYFNENDIRATVAAYNQPIDRTMAYLFFSNYANRQTKSII